MKQILSLMLVPLAAITFLVVPLATIALIFVQPKYCPLDSEENIIGVARSHIEKDVDVLVQHFKEPATDVLVGRFVLVQGFDDRYHPYEVTYQTPSGQFVAIELNSACGARMYYPGILMRREDAVSLRDLRTGESFIRK